MSQETLYFDDLKVGDTFITGTHEVSAADIKRFAAEFDPQPFHLDDEAARHTMFGGLAASGWHTAAITMRLLVTGGPKLANGVLGAGGEIAWKTPTRPGDVLEYHVDKVAKRRNMWWYRGEAKVAGVLVAEAELGAYLVKE